MTAPLFERAPAAGPANRVPLDQPAIRRGGSRRAFVTPEPGVERPSEAGIIQWCRDRIAHYKVPHKVPRTVVFRDPAKTSTRMIQKTVLRDDARASGARREAISA